MTTTEEINDVAVVLDHKAGPPTLTIHHRSQYLDNEDLGWKAPTVASVSLSTATVQFCWDGKGYDQFPTTESTTGVYIPLTPSEEEEDELFWDDPRCDHDDYPRTRTGYVEFKEDYVHQPAGLVCTALRLDSPNYRALRKRLSPSVLFGCDNNVDDVPSIERSTPSFRYHLPTPTPAKGIIL